MPPAPQPLHHRPWLHGLLLCLVTAAAYAGVPHAGFVFDDFALVVYNEGIQELAGVWRYFGQDLWATVGEGVDSGYFRPLMALSLAVDWQLAGEAPAIYHLHSLAWHLLAVWCLHRLLLSVSGPLPAVLGAALFALHPLQSEAVVWVAARNDLMAAALLLGAIVLLRPLALSRGRLVAGAVLAVGAVLSKESTLLLPLFLLALDLAEHGKPRGWPRHALLWGAVGLHLVLRTLAGVTAGAAPPAVGWKLMWVRLPELLGTVGGLLAWPQPLSVGRDLVGWRLGTPGTVLGILALVLLLALLLAARRRLVLVGLAWAAMAVAPSLLAMADKGLFGERYLYLSLAGLGLAVAAGVGSVPAPRQRWLALLGLLVIPWFLMIHQRVPDWKDDISLWRAAARDTPCTYVYAGLGHVLNRDDQRGEAAVVFLEALRGDPPQKGVCSALVDLSARLGHIDRAVAVTAEAVALGCDEPVTRGKQAAYLAMARHWDQAVALAQEIEHDDPEGRGSLVLAAADVVAGDCARYRELRAAWSGDMDAQMMPVLRFGGHPDLASALSDGVLCVDPGPEAP